MPKEVIFDFNKVSFMDSAGIGLVIGRYKLANMLGGKVRVANLTTPVKKIFEMSGMLKIIPEVSSEIQIGTKQNHSWDKKVPVLGQNRTGPKCAVSKTEPVPNVPSVPNVTKKEGEYEQYV